MKPYTLEWYECLQKECGRLAYIADNMADFKGYIRMYDLNQYIQERIERNEADA